MHFTNIQLYNYGIYKGLHDIILLDRNGKKNITLVGGMNGRGKTTLLDSVFLCLYGRKATEFITGKRTAYNKVLKDRINKSAEDKHTYIRLIMDMDDEERTILSITRSWTQKDKKLDTCLSVLKNGVEDAYLSDNWEYYVEELIPFGIARFFFFDNEKISQIADDDAFDKIKSSIKSVMGITTIESLCGHIEKIRKEKTTGIRKSESASLTKESDEVAAAIEANDSRKRSIFTKKASLLPELEKTTALLEQTEQAFWKKGGNLSFNRDSIVRDQHELKEQVAILRESALNLAANPATPLCLCKNLVIDTYSHIKSDEENRAMHYSLPIITKMYGSLLSDFQSAYPNTTDSYQMLSELINHQLEVLEKSAADNHVDTITPLAQGLIERFLSDGAKEITEQASHIVAEDARTSSALAQLEVHLSANAEKTDTVKLLNKIKELQAKKTQLEAEIAQCDDQLRSANFEQEQLMRQQNKIMLKIAAEGDLSDDNVRIVEYSTMTLEVMHEFIHRLQAQKVNQLEKNITSCFEFLAQKQGIITSISIDPETLDITLRDYKGGILLKDQLSAGEKQMFAISILWGLAISSGYKLPVIIDTPMARLDSAHRSNFINKYLPNASSQVIVLSTDEEIGGKYLNDIREYVNTAYTLVYDETEKCSSIHQGYFGGEFV